MSNIQFTRAIVRPPAPNFAAGLTTADLGAPDVPTALAQHAAYCRALQDCGVELTFLEADLRYPDSTFVEDAAVLTPARAVLTNPGAPSRKGEVEAIRPALERYYLHLDAITAPGTLDGGDICEAGSHFFIGLSERTNVEGARQLAAILARDGYTPHFIPVTGIPGILHLKSGIAFLGDNRLVLIDAFADHPAFQGFEVLRVDPAETYAANCLRVNAHVLLPQGFPRLQAAIVALGYPVVPLAMSEFQKMDGGLSCLSLRF